MWLWTSKEWGWISTQTLQSWRPFDLHVQLQSSHLFHNGFPISNFFLFKGKKENIVKHLINIRKYFHDIYFSQQIRTLLIQKKYPTTLLFLISAIIHHNSFRTAVSFLRVSNIPEEKNANKEYSQWSLTVYNQVSHWEERTLHN